MREGSKQKSGPIILTCNPGCITNLLTTLPPTPTLSLPPDLSPTPPASARLPPTQLRVPEGLPRLPSWECPAPLLSTAQHSGQQARHPIRVYRSVLHLRPKAYPPFNAPQMPPSPSTLPKLEVPAPMYLTVKSDNSCTRLFFPLAWECLEANTPLPNSSACSQLGTQHTVSAVGVRVGDEGASECVTVPVCAAEYSPAGGQ